MALLGIAPTGGARIIAFSATLGVVWTELVALGSWLLGTIWAWLTAGIGSLISVFWGWLTGLVGGLLGSVVGWLAALFGVVVGVLWGLVLVLVLLGVAALLNILGVEDVHAVLLRRLNRDDESPSVETIPDVPPEEITDNRGRFSSAAFERVTGLTPAEFVHLFVQTNGGRVKQQTLGTCLPWSEATVSRLLAALEDDDVIERVTLGRENVVCLPEAVPDREL